MQYSEVIKKLRSRADAMLAGQIDVVVKDYVFPVPVDLLSTRVVVSGPAEGSAMLALQCLSMQERGVTAIVPTVKALDLPRSGRFRVWVDWEEMAPPPSGTRRSSAVYYCRADGPDLKIEMIEYVQMSMPELQPRFAALAVALTA